VEFNLTQETVNNIQSGDKDLAELHVLVAESAFQTENYDVARKVVERFLQFSPQLDHVYCRAKVLMGLLINYETRHMNGNESIKWHKFAVAELMVALDVVTKPKNVARYKFMIFNISVSFWKIVHPFLRPNRAKYFVAEMKRMVAALEEQNDPDKEWRIMFLSAAAVCCDDEKNAVSAAEQVDKAIEHADALLQKTLIEEARLEAILKEASAEKDRIMIAFRQIEEQEILRTKPKKIDPDAPPVDPNAPPSPRVLPPLTGLALEGYDKVKSLLDVSQAKKAAADADLRVIVEKRNVQLEALFRLYQQRVSVHPTDAKRFAALPAVQKYPRGSALVQLQCMLSDVVPDKEWEATLQALVKKLAEGPASMVRNETLADLARASWRLNQRKVALHACELALEGNVVNKTLKVKTDICAALKVLSDITLDSANEVSGSRLSVKQAEGYFTTKRIEGVKALESALQACLKLENCQFLAQEICIAMWNALVPLLQTHLRQRVHSSLRAMASALRSVSSPLSLLRHEVHAELALCEDMARAPVQARDEARTSLAQDYGRLDKDGENVLVVKDGPSAVAGSGVGRVPMAQRQLDRNRQFDHLVLPYLNLLEQRCLVYDTPSDVEGQALLWLHQARESQLKPFIQECAGKALFLMLDVLASNGETNKTLKKNAAGVVDYDALVVAKNGGSPASTLQIPPVSLEVLAGLLVPPDTAAGAFTAFTPALQLHHRIMISIASFGHLLEHVPMLQQAAAFVLQPVWNPADPFVREFIDAQIHVRYLVADNMPLRIKSVPFKKPPPQNGFLDLATEAKSQDPSDNVDPRCLGFQSEEVGVCFLLFFFSLEMEMFLFVEQDITYSSFSPDLFSTDSPLVFYV
jgi:hypothetical protein